MGTASEESHITRPADAGKNTHVPVRGGGRGQTPSQNVKRWWWPEQLGHGAVPTLLAPMEQSPVPRPVGL